MLRVFGYLKAYQKASVKFDIREPEVPVSNVETLWKEIYPNAYEEIPYDAPEPKGKSVVMSTTFDSDSPTMRMIWSRGGQYREYSCV